MPIVTDGKKKIELSLPIKITFEGKEYWIKRATKTKGIFLNSQEPKCTTSQSQ